MMLYTISNYNRDNKHARLLLFIIIIIHIIPAKLSLAILYLDLVLLSFDIQ